MKTYEVIQKLQDLVLKHGDAKLRINIEHVKDKGKKEWDILPNDIFYDDSLKDICIIIR